MNSPVHNILENALRKSDILGSPEYLLLMKNPVARLRMCMYQLLINIQVSQNAPLFVNQIQYAVNMLWLFQGLACLAGCIWQSRFGPSFVAPPKYNRRGLLSNLAINQFKSALWMHGIFYWLELSMTDIWVLEPSLVYHHLASMLCVPFAVYHFQRYVSVVYLAPLIIHCYFWTFEDVPMALVYLYNVLLAVSCVVSINAYHASYKRLFRASIRDPIWLAYIGCLILSTNVYTFLIRWNE